MKVFKNILQVAVVIISVGVFLPSTSRADADACYGGSCATASGVKLDCPTSGSKICKSGECCACTCVVQTDGTTSSINTCKDCPKQVATREELADEILLDLLHP